ncbi:MAG TPA: hypothetical protein VG674_16530 [Amycolatopsis sp.]|nr:hypothetical protein [Amycolatopsis sp.]
MTTATAEITETTATDARTATDDDAAGPGLPAASSGDPAASASSGESAASAGLGVRFRPLPRSEPDPAADEPTLSSDDRLPRLSFAS